MKKAIRLLRTFVFYCIGFFFSIIFPLKENKACFLSDTRSVMGGNLKYVYDYLKEKDYEIVIMFKGDRRIQRTFKQNIQLIYQLETSKYILLDDFSKSISNMKVRKNQEIVQLWHGPGAFKKMGISRGDKKTSKFRKFLAKYTGHRNYTKAIVTSDEIKWCYEEAFQMQNKGEIKATGFPRTDDFFNEEYLKSVKEKFYLEYPELLNKKIVLFAPTYRGERVAVADYDFSQIDIDDLYEKLKDEYVFLLKWHPAIFNNIERGNIKAPDFSKYPDFYYDFSSYRDINELLVVCDTLITDYSSVIFDYLLVNKPVVYFTYDLDEYANGRGLYYPFMDYVYGPVAKNHQELIDAICNPNLMEKERELFRNKFMSACDGHSTEKTCKWIFGE